MFMKIRTSGLATLMIATSLAACSGGGNTPMIPIGRTNPGGPASTAPNPPSTPTSGPITGVTPTPQPTGSGVAPQPKPSTTASTPSTGTTGTPQPSSSATPQQSPTNTASPSPTLAPAPPGAYPTMTPIPAGAPPDNAFTILAPSVPLPQNAQNPLCIDGTQYNYALGDDFTQETQGQFASYTTSWEINQYQYPAPQYTGKSNWVWSDALSGIGRNNNAGTDDSYYVHIDDANPSRSYPGAWVNTIQPRPGPQIIGSPPNAYMLIRGVHVPTQYQAQMPGNLHWLSGTIESQNFQYGYTETEAAYTKGDGWWPSDWTEVTPSGNGYYGNGSGYQEFDTFEQFGNSVGDNIQQTRIGPIDSEYSRTSIPDRDITYHKYGQLWVPAILNQPAYIVLYVDGKLTSYYFYNAGVARMNAISVLQIGASGSFVGAPNPAAVGELKLKNYFTWQMSGTSCGSTAQTNPIPMPTASPPPMPAPPVAASITPHMQAFFGPTTTGYAGVRLGAVPPAGALVLLQGISHFAQCPTGFVNTGFGNAYLCSGIVGQNGVVAQNTYKIGGNGFDKEAGVYVTNVNGYSIAPVQFANGQGTSPATVKRSGTATGPNQLQLSFAYNFSDYPSNAPTSTSYVSSANMNIVYQSDSTSTLNDGIALLETSIDPFTQPNATVDYTGTYVFGGTTQANAINAQMFVVTIR